MSKAERLRQVELEMVRMRFEIDLLRDILTNLLDTGIPTEDIDAGKWYTRKPLKND